MAVAFRLKNKGAVVNLTGEQLQIHYTIGDGAMKRIDLANDNPTTGVVVLQPADGNWDGYGIATGRIYITTGGYLGKTWLIHSILVEKDNHQ